MFCIIRNLGPPSIIVKDVLPHAIPKLLELLGLLDGTLTRHLDGQLMHLIKEVAGLVQGHPQLFKFLLGWALGFPVDKLPGLGPWGQGGGPRCPGEASRAVLRPKTANLFQVSFLDDGTTNVLSLDV